MLIEQIVRDFLISQGVAAYTEVPKEGLTTPYVVIERTGGGETEHIRQATMAVQSYGASLFMAAKLNEYVKSVMDFLPERPEVARCRLNSDYNFTDPDTGRHRYQAIYDINYYT